MGRTDASEGMGGFPEMPNGGETNHGVVTAG